MHDETVQISFIVYWSHLECYTVSTGKLLLKFWEILVSSNSSSSSLTPIATCLSTGSNFPGSLHRQQVSYGNMIRHEHWSNNTGNFFIMSHSFLLRMRNVSDKSSKEKHTLFWVTFFFKSWRLWDNVKKIL